jgi:hypothetical protein
VERGETEPPTNLHRDRARARGRASKRTEEVRRRRELIPG